MTLQDEIRAMGERALAASRELALLTGRRKTTVLQAMADEVENRRAAILEANARDMARAEADGLAAAMLDRLRLNAARVDAMVRGMRAVAALKDPIGARISRWIRPNGLEIVKQRVPIGVVAIVYESRPNVTADTAVLCIKTSNAAILRGGRDAADSNAAIADAMIEGGRTKGLPEGAVQLIRTPDHQAVRELVRLEGLVDVVIPRGGEALIRAVTEQALVPVIKHYKGVCHLYVHADADQDMAERIAENAKCQRPGTCNAIEKLLVHEDLAGSFLPRVAARLSQLGVRLKGDERARAAVPSMDPALDEDWTAEYLDLVLTVKVVASLDEAIAHINQYGSRHSDAIVTVSPAAARRFQREVDSAVVYVNASTRFTDGGEFGMGAEIGVSTDKLHARGPMGLEELTTYKYLVSGTGQLRQ